MIDSIKNLKEELKAEQESHATEVETMRAAYEREVTKLQTDLAATQAELSSTQERLEQTNKQLQERQFIVLSHQRAEQALISHAEQVTASLAAATADLGQLFGAWEERLALQGGDRAALQTIQSEVAARLSAMGAKLTAALDAQAAHYSTLTSSLDAFKVQKSADVAALKDQVAAVQAAVTALHAAVGEQAGTTASASSSALSSMSAQVAAYTEQAVAAAGAVQSGSAAAIEALVKSIEAQAASMAEFADKHSSSTAALQATVAASLTEVQARFNTVQASTSAVAKSVQAKLGAASGNLGSFASSFEATGKQQQEALVAQIAALVGAFVGERSQAVAAAVSSVQQQLEADSGAVVTELGTVNEAATSGADAIKVRPRKRVETNYCTLRSWALLHVHRCMFHAR